MKKLSMILLLAVLLIFANIPEAGAAFEWPLSEWNIPFIGTMKTPDGFSAVEVKDFRSLIEQEKKSLSDPKKTKAGKTTSKLPEVPAGTPAILTEALPRDADAAAKRFQKSDFALYHLSMDDGEAVHMAWFAAVRDGEKMPSSIDVFTKDLTPEQTEKLAEFKKWGDDNIHKAQYTDEKSKVSMKLLEIMPLQSYPLKEGKFWTTGGRAMITAEGMPFAFFARAYAMSVEGTLAVAVLFGFDGERPFWDPVIREMMLGIQTNPSGK